MKHGPEISGCMDSYFRCRFQVFKICERRCYNPILFVTRGTNKDSCSHLEELYILYLPKNIHNTCKYIYIHMYLKWSYTTYANKDSHKSHRLPNKSQYQAWETSNMIFRQGSTSDTKIVCTNSVSLGCLSEVEG